MHRQLPLLALVSLLTVSLLPVPLLGEGVAGERPAQPNIVLILADDLGWQDVKCYDIDAPCPMETPNIDALAARGVMFTQAYAPAPTCSPSRCALMSGVHPARAQKTHVLGGHPPRPHHKTAHAMLPPWYSGRMPAGEFTIAKALQQEGYATGHVGKWHMAIDHHAFPQPLDQGFGWSRSSRGARTAMKPDRLSDFATRQADDPYRLDENGFPFHQNSEDALAFLRTHHDEPFFLYYATWLVHAPIHTRSEPLLEKYCRKLGVRPDAAHPDEWKIEGQTNPFYCAMVEELDYHLGKVFAYLNTTEDPRWPGHMLSDNTYLIFTSDNGGMEGNPREIYTDNAPLDRGKISLMEGGTRVPLIITGPGIQAGLQSDVMVSGLDFYPTILSWAGGECPPGKRFDGADLSTLLRENPQHAPLVRDADGQPRDTLVWHFPNSVALESSIRVGDYKLVRNYNHAHEPAGTPLELYRLYTTVDDRQSRGDIEEQENLAESDPQRARAMNARLTEILEEMQASYPYNNPAFRGAGLTGKRVPVVTSHEQVGEAVHFTFRSQGAAVVRAQLLYTTNGNQQYEEWFRTTASLGPGHTITAHLPPGTTHYVLNVIDDNNFLVSYPDMPGGDSFNRTKDKPSLHAITATAMSAEEGSQETKAQPSSPR